MSTKPIFPHRPAHMVESITRAEAELADRRSVLRQWEIRARAINESEWVEYHDKHGWPAGESGYEERLRNSVNVEKKL